MIVNILIVDFEYRTNFFTFESIFELFYESRTFKG